MSAVLGFKRAAIVGCGRVGIGRGSRRESDLWYTHAGAYERHLRTRLVAAVDVDPARLDLCRRVWGIDALYTSTAAVLAAQPIDILSVCTPDDAHVPVVGAAIAAGVPAILCEKPFADSLEAAEELAAAADARGVVLAVNHHRRWESGHQAVKARIAAGALGRIQQVRVWYSGSLDRVGTHAIDFLRYVFGDVVEVTASHGQESSRRIVLRFADDVLATLYEFDQQHFDLFEIDILGSTGRILIADFGARILQWSVEPNPESGGDLELSATPEAIRSDMREAFVNGIDALVAALDSGAPIAASGADAVETLRVVREINTRCAGRAALYT